MELLKQPDNVSCLPTCLAMVLGMEIQEIINEIGHDGKKLLWPDQPEPLCFRGFHEPDLIEVCYFLGYACIPIEFNYMYQSHSGVTPVMMYTEDETNQRFERFLMKTQGIFIGSVAANKKHAVAWDGRQVYDPMEPRIYSFETVGIEKIAVDRFYIIKELQ